MFAKSKLNMSINLALAVGLTSSVISGVAMAQESSADAAEKIEKIQVTGSRIRSANAISTSPINTIGELEFELQQQAEVERVLRNLPGTIPGDNGNVNNGTGGAASVNLRGLGANRNLVLMNGKRMVPFNTAGTVDTSTIPTALIQSIDIVTGGASAVYGSDAISGAINVILKNDFEGVSVDYTTSRTSQGDAKSDNVAITLGGNFEGDRGNAVVSFSWYDRDPLLLGDRALGNYGIATGSGANYQEFLDNTPPVLPTDLSCGGTTPNVVAPGGGSGTSIPTRIRIAGLPANAGGQFRDDGSLVIGPNCSEFNFNPFNYYQTPSERYSATAMAHYDITDDMKVYGTFNFTNTSVRQQVAPSGIFGSTFFVPLSNPFFSDQARTALIDSTNANISGLNGPGFETWRDNNTNGVVDAADDLLLAINRRTLELGPRSTSFNTDQFQLVAGIEGFIGDDWAYDVSIQHGETNRVNSNAGYTNVANIANALNSTDGVTCANGDSTCVPINLFGGFGTITPEMAAYSSATAFSTTEYQQRVLSANVDGPFDSVVSPFADTPLAMSFGYEYREESAFFNPDECLKLAPASCLGGAGGNSLPVGGGFKVNELFTEGKLALVEDMAFAEVVELEFGYRHSNYSTVGETDAWKLGVAWRPNSELLVRLMNQKATRAPNVGELFAPLTSGLDNAELDPCSDANTNISATLRALCISTGMTDAQVGTIGDIVAGQINVSSGSNPNALPDAETASTFTAGFVWSPEFDGLENAVLSVDYYDINVDGYIGTNSPQEVLDGCYVLGNPEQCSLISRIGGGLTISGSGIESFTTNLDYLKTRGIEATYSFGFDLDDYGTLDFSGSLNKYLEIESLTSATSEVIDCLGVFGNNCNPQHELRGSQRASWSTDDVTVSLLWRYFSGIEREASVINTTFEPFREISSYSYFDLVANYAVNDNVVVTLGIDNLFDKEPPVVGGQAGSTSFNGGNTFPSTYDVLGRAYRATVSLKF
jgi:outer membrane receptor protein involved in Fe transport